MSYRVIYDGMFTTVEKSDEPVDNDLHFQHFGEARDAALEYVRTMRNDLNGCINELKALKQRDIDEPWKADEEYHRTMRRGSSPWPSKTSS